MNRTEASQNHTDIFGAMPPYMDDQRMQFKLSPPVYGPLTRLEMAYKMENRARLTHLFAKEHSNQTRELYISAQRERMSAQDAAPKRSFSGPGRW